MTSPRSTPPALTPPEAAFSVDDLLAIFSATPGVNLLLAADAPRFTMVLASDERLAATMTTREATLGRPLFEVFPDANPDNPEPSGVDNLRNSLHTVLRTRAPHRMEIQRYDLRRADGAWEVRYWSPLNVPVFGPDGALRFVLHQVSDVTDAMLGQQALARSEQRAARILDRMADAHFVLDSGLRVVAINPAAERMTGRDRQEVLGLRVDQAFPDSYDEPLDAAYRRVLTDGGEQHLRQHFSRDGSEVILEIDAYATDEGGLAIFARDVTERVRAVEARRKGEAQRFLSGLGDRLYALNDEPAVHAEATRLLAGQLGASSVVLAEALDGADESFVVRAAHCSDDASSHAGGFRPDDRHPGATASLRDRRTLVLAGNEGARDPACVMVPLSREGRLAGCLVVTRPAPRPWTPEEVALLEEAAERVQVAGVRARAESALRDSDRRKDEFLATLAHELRNPLAPVRNGLQILRKVGSDPQAMARTMGMMERQLSHMARLIDDLLEVSRITSGKVNLKRERLALRAVFDSAVEASRHMIEANRHSLTLHLPYEPLHLDVDATRLAQVIGNLINNAAKYTPDGGRIDIHAERQEGEVVIRVEDTGVGIPGPMLSHVFDMFAQVGGSSLERSQGGLGIGLAISRQLILMHGGSIEARSPGVGQGSVFTIRLPLAPEPPRDAEDAGPLAEAGQDCPRRVLVVDDNVDAADSFGAMLALFGHEVKVVYSGADALAAAPGFGPEFIFCDIGMPGMNGHEVARRVRADAALAVGRLVAVTGWGSDEDRRRALEAGFDGHLAKPVDWAVV